MADGAAAAPCAAPAAAAAAFTTIDLKCHGIDEPFASYFDEPAVTEETAVHDLPSLAVFDELEEF